MMISIIIPVFNAEKYLERCVDSVIKSLSDIKGEILLIDNNSTDNSLPLSRKIAERYPKKISVLKCSTPGAGAVRNFGTTKARGKYIWFIDADDTITPDAINKLLKKAEDEKADLVMMGMKRIYADGHTDYLSAVNPTKKDFKSRFIRYGLGPVQVLIKRQWWLDNGFKFMEKAIQEDMELMSVLILYTDAFAAIDEPLYNYHQNPESVLHKTEFSPRIFDIFPALTGLYERFSKKDAVAKYHDELEWFFIWNLLIDSNKDFGNFPEGKPGFQKSREMLKKYFPKWRKNRFLKEKPLKLRLRVYLNYYR